MERVRLKPEGKPLGAKPTKSSSKPLPPKVAKAEALRQEAAFEAAVPLPKPRASQGVAPDWSPYDVNALSPEAKKKLRQDLALDASRQPKKKRKPSKRMRLATLVKLDELYPGEFPHEFMLRVMRTGKIDPMDPDKKKLSPELRLRAAAWSAPYYAPRMSAVSFKADALPYDLSRLAGVTPEEIEVANKVLAIMYGADYSKDAPILPSRLGGITDATMYEESLEESVGDEDEDQ